MKKVSPEFRKKVMDVVRHYAPKLFLEKYRWVLEEMEEEKIKENAVFAMGCSYPYLDARIKFSEAGYKLWEDGTDITPFIVHEMCHLVTDPLYCHATERFISMVEIEARREELTDHICQIVMRK